MVMIWKNIVMLAGFVWFASSYAAHPVVSEDISDAHVHKYDEQSSVKTQKRGIAEEAERDPASQPSKESGPEMKYWRWNDSPTN
jgi:hypothetical protein